MKAWRTESACPGPSCDDGNASTGNDTWNTNCQCVGQVIDCMGVAGGTALPGTACNDNNANTINDVWGANCTCAGTAVTFDCEGVANAARAALRAYRRECFTGNETWNANCQCVGQVIDCLGVAGGSALPGTACNDNNANTINDVWSANCTCAGTLVTFDCEGVANGSALPGSSCNDGNASTGNDTWNANCQCVGQVIDCMGVAGGTALPGTACNDNNANTINDVLERELHLFWHGCDLRLRRRREWICAARNGLQRRQCFHGQRLERQLPCGWRRCVVSDRLHGRGRWIGLAGHCLQRQHCEHDQRCVECELHLRWYGCDL
ncbi:MAG: hypothetical protein IPO05_13270 [Flavobacteriales bacterium]|nr:hypothetical protein [Flavobacteriales bacterium]